MENKNYYSIVGVFFVAVCTAIFIFVWWLGAKDQNKMNLTSYYVHTNELPSGLKEGSTVKFIGVMVGSIKKINFIDPQQGLIEIELAVAKGLPITKNSVAKVETQALSGVSTINITKGEGMEFEDGEKRIISLDPTILDKLSENAKEISQTINETLKKFQEVLSKDNVDKIHSIISSIDNVALSINDSNITSNLADISNSLKLISYSLEDNKTGISALLINSNKFFKSANSLTTNLNSTSNKLDKFISEISKGSANGDYNLREILSPTLNELNLVLKEIQNALFRLQDSPYDFFLRQKDDK